MRIYAISDLHLSFTSNKPMDKFGEHWYKHHEKIDASWRRMVGSDDVVLVPGDHSWGLRLDEALPDLQWIGNLPGQKVLGKGNHDLWWQSISRLEALALPNTRWLQNNAFVFDDVGVCGTRGWSFPGGGTDVEDQHDDKIYKREIERLKLSFQALDKLRKKNPVTRVICMLHYPPLLNDKRDTEFTALLESQGVDVCIYGHVHLSHKHRVFRGEHQGVQYDCVSCDLNDFAPILLHESRQLSAVSPTGGEGP